MFSGQIPEENCATKIGGMRWGASAYINVQFQTKDKKEKNKKVKLVSMIAFL